MRPRSRERERPRRNRRRRAQGGVSRQAGLDEQLEFAVHAHAMSRSGVRRIGTGQNRHASVEQHLGRAEREGKILLRSRPFRKRPESDVRSAGVDERGQPVVGYQ